MADTKKLIEIDEHRIELPVLGYWKVREAIGVSEVNAKYDLTKKNESRAQISAENMAYMFSFVEVFFKSRLPKTDLDNIAAPLLAPCFDFFMAENPKIEKANPDEAADPNPKAQTGKGFSGNSSSTIQGANDSKAGKPTLKAA